MYHWDFYTVLQSFDLFLDGIWTTFLYTLGSVVLGVVIGLLACFARLSRFAALRLLARSYQELFRCTPLLVQVLWAYYALPMVLGVTISNTTAGLLTLSLYVGSFYAEIFRGGINAIDKGQREAAAAIGMSPTQTMARIILPFGLLLLVGGLFLVFLCVLCFIFVFFFFFFFWFIFFFLFFFFFFFFLL